MVRFQLLLLSLILTLSLVSASIGEDYIAVDSEFRWVEIEDIGSPVEQLRDNSFNGPFPIGFRFPYNGQIYEEHWICANGLIGFGPTDGYNNQHNSELPYHFQPNNIVALYWKDLDPEAFWADNPTIYRGMRNGNRIIQYQNFPEKNDDGRADENSITMQIILRPDGDILFQYKSVGEDFDLTVGTVGVENIDGSQGLTARFDGEGIEIADETAYRITSAPPGNYLVWDGGSETASGEAESAALESLGHAVTFLHLADGENLPNNLADYDGVFVNLGNIGEGGNHYHVLTDAEGQRLANYLEDGGSLYMEGSDTWTEDRVTEVHPFFMIQGVGAGAVLEPPVTAVEGSFTEGMMFDAYEADHNNSVDHLATIENAQELFSYMDRNGEFIGMVGFLGREYRTVGSAFEFGGLIDGDRGTKVELMRRMLRFFRTPPTEFLTPANLRAIPGDQEVTLTWDYPPHEGRDLLQVIELQHDISQLSSDREKPDQRDSARIVELRERLSDLQAQLNDNPRRDELTGFNIYINGERYDFTNAHRYTAIELANGEEYEFTVTSVHADPDGESEPTAVVTAVPSGIITPPYRLDFEQTRGPFVPMPSDDGWQWGEPAVGAASGTRAWGTLLDEPYGDLETHALYTPVIDLRGQRIAWFSFNHYMESEPGWDGGRVEISLNGDRWSTLTPRGGYNEETVFAFNDHPGFSGSTDGWEPVTFDLGAYLNRQIQLRFVFKSDDSNFRDYAGWFIDDIWLSGPDLGDFLITVVEEDNETPILGARVALGDEYVRNTDPFGLVRFNSVPEGVWELSVSKIGYITVEDDIDINGNGEVQERVILDQWGSFLSLEPEDFDVQLNAGMQSQDVITLVNDGERGTSYRTYIAYDPENDNRRIGNNDRNGEPRRDEPWDLVQTYDLTGETGEQFFIGAQFVQHGTPQDYRLIAGAGDFANDACYFYQFSREGEYLGRVEQDDFDLIGWGLRDLTYDGQYVYGAVNNSLYEIDPITGDVNFIIEDLEYLNLNRAVTYIPEEQAFWLGDGDDRWFKIHRETLRLLDVVADHGLTGVTGMAWNPADPDGAYLYIHNQETENGGAAIYRFNPETRELFRQIETATEDEGSAGGLFVTYLYDTHNYHVGALIQGHDGNDVVKLYELQPYDGWLSVNPSSGDIGANGEVELAVTFDASNLTQSVHQATIEIYDLNTGIGLETLCRLEVVGGLASITANITFDDDADIFEAVFLDLYDAGGRLVNVGFPDDNGNVELADLNPGNYLLEVVGIEGYEDWFSDAVVLEPDQEAHFDIVIEHIRLGGGVDFPALRGRVASFEDDDFGLQGVEIAAVLEEDPVNGVQRFYTAMTDEDGLYVFAERLPEGDYTVTAHLIGWRSDSQEGVEIREGNETELDFVMNDRLAVQSARTNGYADDSIQLIWLPPGTVGEEITLQYDSNILANGMYMPNRNDMLAVRFEPEGEYDILAFSIYIFGDGDLGRNDWPDWREDAFNVNLFSEDPETGLPGELLFTEFVDDDQDQQWVTVEPDLGESRFLRGPVYFGWHQEVNPRFDRYEALGLDDSFDHAGTVFARFDNIWEEYNALPGDPMMRLLIWSYFEDRPVEIMQFGNGGQVARAFHQPDRRVSLLNPNAPSMKIYSDPFADLYGKLSTPRRDPAIGYRVFVDGELAVDDLDEEMWIHAVGSENEGREYNYMISSIYQGDEEPIYIDGAEVTGVANMPPGRVRFADIEVDGLSYSLSWISPIWNEDRSNCTDYAGCRIYLDGEAIDFVPVHEEPEMDEYIWNGQLEDGQDGWHTIHLIAEDEVPNSSVAVEMVTAIGQAAIHDFEGGDRPIFTASPRFNGWELSDDLDGGPRTAHSGRFAWGVRPDTISYPDDADVYLTSHLYAVMGEGVALDFYHFMSCEEGNDGGQILISVDEGEWELIEPDGGYDDDRIDALINTPGFTGETGGWEQVGIDLGEYRGHTVRFRFRFASDHTLNNYGGWFIDDVVLWGCELAELGEVSGTVTDQNGTPVLGASVSDGRVTATSNMQGNYELSGIFPGNVTLTTSKPGYRPMEEQIMVEFGDILEQHFALYRPEIVFDPNEFEFELRAGEQLDEVMAIANDGEESAPWSIRVSATAIGGEIIEEFQPFYQLQVGDTPRRDDPWDQLFGFDLTELTGHRRFQGAQLVDNQFLLSVADPVTGALIDRVNIAGEYLGSIRLPLDAVGWGMRDLTWDGEMLYGSQNDSIYSFAMNGQPGPVQAGAPIDLNRALAYDRETDGFWAAEWGSPWYHVNRDGDVTFSWDGHELNGVYGFAYHPQDADGMFLYVFNREDDGSTGVYRSDPHQGTIELVHEIEGAPRGCFISGAWDQSYWVLGGIADDNLVGLELNRREAWITVEPLSGELEGNEDVDVTITINMPDAIGDDDQFHADLSIRSYGGEVGSISVDVTVMDGFRHFNTPVENDEHMSVQLGDVTVFGEPLSWGSEIAAFTPDGAVGGVGRWFGRECSFKLYAGEDGFERGNAATFAVWDAQTGQEFTPLVNFVNECRGFNPDSTWSLTLDVIDPITQSIHLSKGWNLISSSVQPLSPFMDHIWGVELESGNLALLKGKLGIFWAPSFNFRSNGLFVWNPRRGYQVMVVEETDISVSGRRQSVTETVIPLNAGHNMIAYIPEQPLPPETALAGVMDDVYRIKDGRGNFIMPEWGYYGIPAMEPGQGYKLWMNNPTDLIYQTGPAAIVSENNSVYGGDTPPTGSDMSLLILGIENLNPVSGQNLVVLAGSDRRPVVDITFPSVSGRYFPCGVIVRGDDTMTQDIEGAQNEEQLAFAIRNSSGELVELECEVKAGDLIFSDDGFAVVELVQPTLLPTEFSVEEVYPNPFNGRAAIRFGLPEAAEVAVSVWSIQGRQVSKIPTRRYEIGWHSVEIDASTWSSGVYFVEVSMLNSRSVRKMVLAR